MISIINIIIMLLRKERKIFAKKKEKKDLHAHTYIERKIDVSMEHKMILLCIIRLILFYFICYTCKSLKKTM